MIIDLQDDGEVPVGRTLFEQLVGAHMAARDEIELVHMTNIAMSELSRGDAGRCLRILTHAVYHAQSLVMGILDEAACHAESLDLVGGFEDRSDGGASRSFRSKRLEIWDRVRRNPMLH